ncbi:MAG: HAD-IC family P-type ATPase, partial [Planctomycetales bacterium]|nr:HAD-IC family P-type ATPase [Planctomycetales bacterium]
MMRLGLAVFFSMNVMVFTMLLWSQPQAADQLSAVWYDLARYACLLFTLPVVLLLGGPILEDAAVEIRRGRPSMSLLLCVGIAASLFYSIWSLWTGGHVYFEVAAVILVAVTLGRWFEATGKLKTSAALRGLKQLLPDQVRLLSGEREEMVPSSHLAAGDTFRVLPGERIVADGDVVRHSAAVDEQAVTGESMPVVRQPGEQVMSGTLVLDGPLDIRAAASAGEGTLARMIEAVTKATSARTRYERLAEKISRWFLPAVGLIALATFTFHTWFGDLASGLLAALAVLVIACPCALGLATPMALWAAVGRAAQVGVLLRDGDALSLLAKAKTVCFDKTGTLTTGDAVVDKLWISAGSDQDEVLAVAQSLSRSSNHPLSAAIGRYAAMRHPNPYAEPQSFFVRAGRGIAGHIE